MGFHWLRMKSPSALGHRASLRTPWPSPWASIAHAWPPPRAANAAPRPGPRPMPRWRGRRPRIRRVRWKPRVACAGSWRSRRWKPIKCFFLCFLIIQKGFSSSKRVCTICLIHEMLDGGFLFFECSIPKFGEDGSIWTSIFFQIELKPPTSQLLVWDEKLGVQLQKKSPRFGRFFIFLPDCFFVERGMQPIFRWFCGSLGNLFIDSKINRRQWMNHGF